MIRKALDHITGARRLDPTVNNDHDLKYKYNEELDDLKQDAVWLALFGIAGLAILGFVAMLLVVAYGKFGWGAALIFPGIPLTAWLYWYGVYRLLKRHLDTRFAEAILVRGGRK